MEDFSILIGGIAGDGINEAGLTAARLMNRLGYRIFMYYDYPSLIKGGHNFSMVRASSERIGVCRDEIDLLIALNQDTVDRHSGRLKEGSAAQRTIEQLGLQDAVEFVSGISDERIVEMLLTTCFDGLSGRHPLQAAAAEAANQ